MTELQQTHAAAAVERLQSPTKEESAKGSVKGNTTEAQLWNTRSSVPISLNGLINESNGGVLELLSVLQVIGVHVDQRTDLQTECTTLKQQDTVQLNPAGSEHTVVC